MLPWTKSIQYEEELSADDIELYDHAVREYLYDRNWVNTCKRMGMSSTLAHEYATRFAQNSYVQKCLRREEEKIAASPETTTKVDVEQKRQRIIAQLEEQSIYNGPGSSHAARVAALKQLCSIYGFEAPKQTQVAVGVSSGVMLVPAMASLADWEASAKAAQEKLQEETMNGLGLDGTIH